MEQNRQTYPFTCQRCGTVFYRRKQHPKYGRNKYCSNKCRFANYAGDSNPNYKGNKPYIEKHTGYLIRKVIGEERHEYIHRSVMEQHIGRKLRTDEFIHHINGDKRDNRIENLTITSNPDHLSLHHKEIVKTRHRDWHGRFVPKTLPLP